MSCMGCAEARDELASVLGDEKLGEHTPLLVWANKMDIEGSITESELSDQLALWKRPDCKRRPWCVQGSVMHDRGLGMEHGMKWLYLTLAQKPSKKWTSAEHATVENRKVEKVTPTEPNAKPVHAAAPEAKPVKKEPIVKAEPSVGSQCDLDAFKDIRDMDGFYDAAAMWAAEMIEARLTYQAQRENLANLCRDFNVLPIDADTTERAMAKDLARKFLGPWGNEEVPNNAPDGH
jgi:hypothetical protein